MKIRNLPRFALLALTGSAAAEVEQEIPFGIEAVTGYRSEYIQRGFKLGDNILDFQAQAEVAWGEQLVSSFGAWYATGSDSFSETAAFANLRWESDLWSIGFETAWMGLKNSPYQDGFDFSPFVEWHLSDDWDLAGGLAWNTGADGLYAFGEARWSQSVGRSGLVHAEAGISGVSDYYGRSGINDAYGRISYTYIFNRSVSLSPFMGSSVPLQSDAETTRLFGGIWFEVNF